MRPETMDLPDLRRHTHTHTHTQRTHTHTHTTHISHRQIEKFKYQATKIPRLFLTILQELLSQKSFCCRIRFVYEFDSVKIDEKQGRCGVVCKFDFT